MVMTCACTSAPPPPAPVAPLPPGCKNEAPAPSPAPGAPTVAATPTPATPTKAQPSYIKLRLGHYHNERLGIGVTIDLTEQTENVADIDPAKIRFDGDSKVWRLDGRYGSRERIDYANPRGAILLEVWNDGRRAVRVPDPDGHLSDEIAVVRDGDADPL